VADAAVIFDVDGVLLELTRAEEEIFFTALQRFVPTDSLSRDWNSYRIRNDDDIITEILERHDVAASRKAEVIAHYITLLQTSRLNAVSIKGAGELLQGLSGKARLGIATANLLGAAQHRLQQAGFWSAVSHHAQGADGGGHKSVILQRAIATLNLPLHRIVFIGDNINDVEAGLRNGVHFIAFSESAGRREILVKAGATHVSAHHEETQKLITQLLA
jgi:phosphoglycolate phosphatase-like HAD superfamily hydrolase